MPIGFFYDKIYILFKIILKTVAGTENQQNKLDFHKKIIGAPKKNET